MVNSAEVLVPVKENLCQLQTSECGGYIKTSVPLAHGHIPLHTQWVSTSEIAVLALHCMLKMKDRHDLTIARSYIYSTYHHLRILPAKDYGRTALG